MCKPCDCAFRNTWEQEVSIKETTPIQGAHRLMSLCQSCTCLCQLWGWLRARQHLGNQMGNKEVTLIKAERQHVGEQWEEPLWASGREIYWKKWWGRISVVWTDEVIRKERLREGCGSLGDVMVWDSSRRTAKFSCHHISDPRWASGTAAFGRNDRILKPEDFS